MKIRQFAEDALTIYLGDEIDEAVNRQIVALRHHIEAQSFEGVVEVILSYTSLIIHFEVFSVDLEKLKAALEKIDIDALVQEPFQYRVIEIPVCYGGEYGPDIGHFEASGLSEEDVVRLHADTEYLVYMLGFMPGFPFLGGLDERLHKDRLETPRVSIPAGSVGIGGRQTGMYPFESPGGWHLLGRTPVPLFDADRNPAILYGAGDRIVYRSIGEDEYKDIEKRVAQGDYEVNSEVRNK
ncbi:5-oxoprolinase subunit PxpB [Salinicoccus siamensis]|uniref:5-oxoprolinase subunit PxpB n=1 Tax=Salinicoccus siamensis TaxID=381830 RepID=A0ABV5Z5J4_9STAP